jgi:copper oxidase (laccase) domain-containing protein
VIEATIAAMRAPAASLQAWLGPSIGPRAFEVGPDVHAAFCEHAPQDAALFVPTAADKWLADLPGLARQRLERAGVNRVFGGTHCTYGDGERFFSYRRDRTPARLSALVWRALAR